MSHCMLHALPIKIAIDFEIPLVFLGENSAQYSGDEKYDARKLVMSGLKNMLQIVENKKIFSRKHKYLTIE